MKYVKLTAKPNTWFKENTEVYYCSKQRFTLEEWEYQIKNYIGVLVSGIREDYSCDEELCDFDEFDVEIVDEKFGSSL
jgi:hypothetical protein